MTTELQEEFKEYVFEDVKANIDEWVERRTCNYKEATRNFRDRIIELRHQYAKNNGFKTVTPLCPKPNDLEHLINTYINEYVSSERDRMYEEYKPLAVAKVLNDEALRDKLNATIVKNFLNCDFYSGFIINNFIKDYRIGLAVALRDHYREIQLTLSNPTHAAMPSFYDLAIDIFKSLFTPSLTFKFGDVETTKEVA